MCVSTMVCSSNLTHLQAIHNYRETERTKWTPESQTVIDRIRAIAFDDAAEHIGRVHVLDLHKEGRIKPHIDSVRV